MKKYWFPLVWQFFVWWWLVAGGMGVWYELVGISWGAMGFLNVIGTTSGLLVLEIPAFISLYLKWRSDSWVERTLKKIRSKDYKKQPSPLFLTLSHDGFNITKRTTNETLKVEWKKISRIVAFKRDLFTYDCVCVLFETLDGKGIEIDEQMDGFTQLMEEAPKYCVGCKTFHEWYMNITTPAFATNLTELYKQS
jgi:hypothetical protein